MSQNEQTEKKGAVCTLFSYKGSPEFLFDVRDADDAEKFENGLDALRAAEANVPKDGKLSKIARANCKMIKDFMDTCLGAGASQAIFGERNHLQEVYDAYEAFLNMVAAQRDELHRSQNNFCNRGNRQQRRRQKHKRGGNKK